MKTCNKCKKSKEESEFTFDKRNKDGLQGSCNCCKNNNRNLKYSTDLSYRELIKSKNKKYNQNSLIRVKKHISTLSDIYVIASLKRGTDLTTKDIRQFPNLIDLKRQELTIKRNLKNEKHKTS